MDISSKYFSKLRQPGFHWIKLTGSLLLDLYRVGKLREVVSFIVWEVMHRLRFYELQERYVKFTDTGDPVLRIGADLQLIYCDRNAELATETFCVEPVAIDWKYCFIALTGVRWGCLFSSPNALYRSEDNGRSATLTYTFPHPIQALFVSRQHVLFVCVEGVIYRSSDEGNSFEPVLRLSTPISYFLFNNGMTELPDHTLVIGEYGSLWHGQSWQNLAFLYYSSDGGKNWETSDFLIRQGVNKHIHLVRYCTYLNGLLLTDGDNKKQIWINKSLTGLKEKNSRHTAGWHLLNQYHHQTGGYTSMAETEAGVVFGSDYLGGTNFIITTTDGERLRKQVLPDPYRRSPVMNMVTSRGVRGTEIWACSYSCLSSEAKSLLMYSGDSGKSWTRVIEFDGTTHEVRLVSSSHDSSADLYISITAFGSRPDQHRHKLYRIYIPVGTTQSTGG